MLRINLLPLSVNQRRWTSRIIIASVVAALICFALPFLYSLKLSHDLTAEKQLADAAVAGKHVTDDLKAKAAGTTAQIQPIQAKVDFVTAVHKYHMALVRIYYTLAQYTDSKVIYSDAAYTGTTMTVHAYTPSLAEMGRYLQRMYHNIQVDRGPNAVFSNVSIDHVPGYPEGYVNNYYVGNTLVAVGAPPTGVSAPGSAQSSGSAQTPASAPPPGQNTNAPGSSAASASGAAGGQTGSQTPRTPADASTPPITPLETLYQRQLNPLSVPRQQQEFLQHLRHSVRIKRVPQGFEFTATLTLANPPVAPTVPGGTAPAPSAGLGK